MIFEQKNGNFRQILVSNWVSVHLVEVSVSISVSKLGAKWYQYCIGIKNSDLHSISIVTVSEQVKCVLLTTGLQIYEFSSEEHNFEKLILRWFGQPVT